MVCDARERPSGDSPVTSNYRFCFSCKYRAFFENAKIGGRRQGRRHSKAGCAKKDDAAANYALDRLPNLVVASEYRFALPDENVLVEELERVQQAKRDRSECLIANTRNDCRRLALIPFISRVLPQARY